MAEDRQAKGRLSDKQIAVLRLERRAGRIGPALVVARNHNPAAAVVEHDLGAAEYMTRRHQSQAHFADQQDLAAGERLQDAARPLAIARLHDRDRLGRRQHLLVAGASVVAVPMGDDGARPRPRRIDVEVARLAVEPGRRRHDPGLGPRRSDRHQQPYRSGKVTPIWGARRDAKTVGLDYPKPRGALRAAKSVVRARRDRGSRSILWRYR